MHLLFAETTALHVLVLSMGQNELQTGLGARGNVIWNLLAQTVDQDVVVNPVEERLQVHIHHDTPPGLRERLRRQDGIVCAFARMEAVAVGTEGGGRWSAVHRQRQVLR